MSSVHEYSCTDDDDDDEVAKSKSKNCAEVECVSLSTDINIFYYMQFLISHVFNFSEKCFIWVFYKACNFIITTLELNFVIILKQCNYTLMYQQNCT